MVEFTIEYQGNTTIIMRLLQIPSMLNKEVGYLFGNYARNLLFIQYQDDFRYYHLNKISLR